MVTREDEIEARAWALFTHQQGNEYTMERCLGYAETAVDTVLAWRAARQPAPEAEQPTPTPPSTHTPLRSLAPDIRASQGRCTHLLELANATGGDVEFGWEHNLARVSAILKAHAATLKAQQRGEARDG